MKILHTADIHLKATDDERWEAFAGLINIANANKCDVITISGDLFNSGVDAEKLRPALRGLFSQANSKVLIIPGNHDKNVYKEGYHFGENVQVLKKDEPVRIGNCVFWGLPFESYDQKEVLECLFAIKRRIDVSDSIDEIHFLLLHGESVDSLFSIKDFGEEGRDRYMPFRISYFDNLGIDFVLAGHFHTNCTIRQFQGGYFIYPGSPVSITRREIGKRKVVLIDTETDKIDEVVINSFYYDLKEVFLNPFNKRNPLDEIKNALTDVDKNAGIILNIYGYIDKARHGLNEETFHKRLTELINSLNFKYPPQCEENYKDISAILEDELFKEFEKRLGKKNFEKEKSDRIQELFIKAMIEVAQR